MKVVASKSASGGPIPLNPTDILSYFSLDSDRTTNLMNGKRLTSAMLGGKLFHGSSVDFDFFTGNNIFLTPDIEGAIGFASLSEWFRGNKTDTKGWMLYVCTLRLSKAGVYEANTDAKQAELLDRSRAPADGKCREFLEERGFQAIHFSGGKFSDAGLKDVWFTNNPSLVQIVRKFRVFPVQGRPSKQVPTGLVYLPLYGGANFRPVEP